MNKIIINPAVERLYSVGDWFVDGFRLFVLAQTGHGIVQLMRIADNNANRYNSVTLDITKAAYDQHNIPASSITMLFGDSNWVKVDVTITVN